MERVLLRKSMKMKSKIKILQNNHLQGLNSSMINQSSKRNIILNKDMLIKNSSTKMMKVS
jgi:hypothetical protein